MKLRFAQQMTFLSATELEPETHRWLGSLTPTLRPDSLARDYPQVANRIAFLWPEPTLMRRYFDDLTQDEYGGPPPLSAEAVLEIDMLRAAYASLHPVPADSTRGLSEGRV